MGKSQQRIADEFNAKHQVGQSVIYWSGLREGEGVRSRTRTTAQMMCGHAVVWVEGKANCIALSHVQPVRE